MSRPWLLALLAIAACSPEPVLDSQAAIHEALRMERPDQQLQQVHPMKVGGKTAFCGTTGTIAERKSGQPVRKVEAFLFMDDRFYWATGPAGDAAVFQETCKDAIYKGDILR